MGLDLLVESQLLLLQFYVALLVLVVLEIDLLFIEELFLADLLYGQMLFLPEGFAHDLVL